MSNTGAAYTQWKQLAETLGFPDETQMWVQFYMVEKRPLRELSKTLGFGSATIARRLQLCGVEKRPRGGITTSSKIRIALAHMDQRFVRLSAIPDVAKILNVSTHSVYRLLKED